MCYDAWCMALHDIGGRLCRAQPPSFFRRIFMEEKLKEYAKLLIEVGLNVQKGQTLAVIET